MPLFGPPDIRMLSENRDVKKLIKALGYRDLRIRLSAADALAVIGDVRAIEPFIQLLKDNDKEVVASAQRALVMIGEPAVTPLIKELKKNVTAAIKKNDPNLCKATATTLANVGVPAVEPIIAALDINDPYFCGFSASVLGNIGKPAVEPLIAALKKYDSFYIRQTVASALGEIGDMRAIDPLCAALKDENRDVRVTAADALVKIGDAKALDSLGSLCNDQDADVRQFAQNSLAQLQKKLGISTIPEPEPRPQPVHRAGPEFVTGNVLAMAVVYEGHVIEEPDPAAIANELLSAFSQAGILKGVTLHPHSVITLRRADESAWYRGDYEPGSELPQMLNEGIGLLRNRLLAAGQNMGKINVRTVRLQGRSRVVSTCWVGIHIIQ
jgi:HEAT repeat protein